MIGSTAKFVFLVGLIGIILITQIPYHYRPIRRLLVDPDLSTSTLQNIVAEILEEIYPNSDFHSSSLWNESIESQSLTHFEQYDNNTENKNVTMKPLETYEIVKFEDKQQNTSEILSKTKKDFIGNPQFAISVPEQDPNCIVPNAKEIHVSNPTWTASYPGSGAKLTWKLIRAITGIFTSDDHDHNGRVKSETVVAVKTHYPSKTHQDVFDGITIQFNRAILLLRNPMNAIPSYCNFVYEMGNKLINHSTRAPIFYWIKWRDTHFENELKLWVEHQRYWLDNYSTEKGELYHMSLEDLTSKEKGVETLKSLGEFLKSGGDDIAESMVPPSRMGCIWEMFVDGTVPGERQRRVSLRQGGPTSYPFTEIQFDRMIEELAKLQIEYHSCPKFPATIGDYIRTIQIMREELTQNIN